MSSAAPEILAPVVLAGENWEAYAACRGGNPELFFPLRESKKGAPTELAALAIAVCEQCPVAQECLEGALERDERFGIWGGKTTTERREMVRQRARLAARSR